MDAFYIVGSALAAWALILAGLGIFIDGFPGSALVEKAVAVFTVVLVGCAIAAAIYQASTEPDDGDPNGKTDSALLLR